MLIRSRAVIMDSLSSSRVSIERLEVSEILRRAVPGGTVGGRIALAAKPARANSCAKLRAQSLEPRITGTICESDGPTSKPASRRRRRR